jgi:shikimate kinase
MTPDRVVLVGMMGAGKTTVGTALARRLGRPYWDSDAEIRRTAGRGVAEVFADDGEERLHQREAEVLDAALDREGPAVIGAPASVALDAGLSRRLGREHVVWLRAMPTTLAARVAEGPPRPFLSTTATVLDTVTALAAERSGRFAAIATHVVDVDGKSVPAIVDEIVAAFASPS